jgi:hypothetical protein
LPPAQLYAAGMLGQPTAAAPCCVAPCGNILYCPRASRPSLSHLCSLAHPALLHVSVALVRSTPSRCVLQRRCIALEGTCASRRLRLGVHEREGRGRRALVRTNQHAKHSSAFTVSSCTRSANEDGARGSRGLQGPCCAPMLGPYSWHRMRGSHGTQVYLLAISVEARRCDRLETNRAAYRRQPRPNVPHATYNAQSCTCRHRRG